MDEEFIKQMWPFEKMEFMGVDAEGTARGLLCIWNPDRFRLEECYNSRQFVMLSGIARVDFKCTIVNIYASNDVVNRRLKRKLANLKAHLKRWNSEVFGNVDVQLKRAEEEYHKFDLVAESRTLSESEMLRRRVVRTLVWNLSRRKESLWHQKSRIVRAKCGDKNARFFHMMVSSRQRKNMLDSVVEGGVRLVEPDEVKQVVFNYFAKRFTEEWCSRPKLSGIFSSINSRQNDNLVAAFTEQEIWEAIHDCDGNKAPGPDGFNMACFQKCWKIMKNEILQFMTEFHENGKLGFRFE
ncbi:uncharacterized protein LOC114296740 [Camellia sinensis]|uniref:uncharacterized protein LOC114296740 n=1 Tax=Camellia sinensis TaxID=4442 RepID=UPI001035A3C9|nr:uncharacterized protein LOC114296740 [Camellia sinensis]